VTAPDLSFIIPLKYKTYVSLIGSALSFVVPFVLQSVDALPAPWPAAIGVVLFLLSALGVYKAPYKPTGTVLVPEKSAVPNTELYGTVTDAETPDVISGTFKNPWKP
jgi:hypothetical protein